MAGTYYCSICKVNDRKIHTHYKRDIEDNPLPDEENINLGYN